MLGPYELLEKIGEGGMGAVFKARHTRLKKVVAIKVMSPSSTRDPDAVARFAREMEAVGRLEHPNIVRALHADEHQGTHYLVMEYVEGQDLKTLIKERGPLPVADACGLLRQVASALDYAHGHGLIHRDIKPSNLIITSQGQLKVLDLGLARLGQIAEGEELTTTGVSMGTPDYMAPEQWADTRRVDHRCDLYSAGCTLFYLLTGRVPYGGEGRATALSKMDGHAHEEIPMLSSLRSDIPPGLDQLFKRLLAKQPSARLGTAAELVKLLEPFCGAPSGIEMQDLRTESSFVFTDQAGGGAAVSSSKPTIILGKRGSKGEIPARRGANRLAKVAAGAVAAAMLAGVVYWMTHRQEEPVPRSVTVVSQEAKVHPVPPAKPVVENREIDLWRLFGSECIANGSTERVRVEGDVLTLDGTHRDYPDLWVNFLDVQGKDLTIRTQLRVVQFGDNGYAKLVFMTHTFPELFALLIDEGDGTSTAYLDSADKTRKRDQGVEFRLPADGSYVDVAYTLSGDRLELRIDDRLVLEGPRPARRQGFIALGAGGWKVELKQPRVILLPAPEAESPKSTP
jgi:serine/threonine protein kinase